VFETLQRRTAHLNLRLASSSAKGRRFPLDARPGHRLLGRPEGMFVLRATRPEVAALMRTLRIGEVRETALIEVNATATDRVVVTSDVFPPVRTRPSPTGCAGVGGEARVIRSSTMSHPSSLRPRTTVGMAMLAALVVLGAGTALLTLDACAHTPSGASPDGSSTPTAPTAPKPSATPATPPPPPPPT
jgi:hypothetical protein